MRTNLFNPLKYSTFYPEFQGAGRVLGRGGGEGTGGGEGDGGADQDRQPRPSAHQRQAEIVRGSCDEQKILQTRLKGSR